eukprot:1458183-Rhodomonas_salina.1
MHVTIRCGKKKQAICRGQAFQQGNPSHLSAARRASAGRELVCASKEPTLRPGVAKYISTGSSCCARLARCTVFLSSEEPTLRPGVAKYISA